MTQHLKLSTKLMGKGLTVSTVEVGSFIKDPIERSQYQKDYTGKFETMVFHYKTGEYAWESQLYQKEVDARKGHRAMVEKLKKTSRVTIRKQLVAIKNST